MRLQNGTTWENFIDNLKTENKNDDWKISGDSVVCKDSGDLGVLSEDKTILTPCKKTDPIEARDYYYNGADESL